MQTMRSQSPTMSQGHPPPSTTNSRPPSTTTKEDDEYYYTYSEPSSVQVQHSDRSNNSDTRSERHPFFGRGADNSTGTSSRGGRGTRSSNRTRCPVCLNMCLCLLYGGLISLACCLCFGTFIPPMHVHPPL